MKLEVVREPYRNKGGTLTVHVLWEGEEEVWAADPNSKEEDCPWLFFRVLGDPDDTEDCHGLH